MFLCSNMIDFMFLEGKTFGEQIIFTLTCRTNGNFAPQIFWNITQDAFCFNLAKLRTFID